KVEVVTEGREQLTNREHFRDRLVPRFLLPNNGRASPVDDHSMLKRFEASNPAQVVEEAILGPLLKGTAWRQLTALSGFVSLNPVHSEKPRAAPLEAHKRHERVSVVEDRLRLK